MAVAEPCETLWEKPPSDFQTPLATFPEDGDPQAPEAPIEGVRPPGSFFAINPDERPTPSSGTPDISSGRRGGRRGKC